MIAEQLKEAEELYPSAWIEDAIFEAVSQNKRSWRYIARILERWEREGRGDGEPGRHPKRLATTRNLSNGEPVDQAVDDAHESPDACEICRGRGWYTHDVPAGHPDFGQTVTCKCQQERLEEERSRQVTTL